MKQKMDIQINKRNTHQNPEEKQSTKNNTQTKQKQKRII